MSKPFHLRGQDLVLDEENMLAAFDEVDAVRVGGTQKANYLRHLQDSNPQWEPGFAIGRLGWTQLLLTADPAQFCVMVSALPGRVPRHK